MDGTTIAFKNKIISNEIIELRGCYIENSKAASTARDVNL